MRSLPGLLLLLAGNIGILNRHESPEPSFVGETSGRSAKQHWFQVTFR
jgi:hypothetical protein